MSLKKLPDLNGVSPEFAELSDKVHRKALRVFEAGIKAKIDDIPCLLVAIDEEGKKTESAFIRFHNDREKKMAYSKFLLRLAAKNFKLQYLFTATEAWMATTKKEDAKDWNNMPRPSQDPNRVDAFMVTGGSKDEGYRFFKTYRVARQGNKPIGLIDASMSELVPEMDEKEANAVFQVRSAEDREERPELTERAFNLWNVIHLTAPMLEEGLPHDEINRRLLNDHGIDMTDGKCLP